MAQWEKGEGAGVEIFNQENYTIERQRVNDINDVRITLKDHWKGEHLFEALSPINQDGERVRNIVVDLANSRNLPKGDIIYFFNQFSNRVADQTDVIIFRIDPTNPLQRALIKIAVDVNTRLGRTSFMVSSDEELAARMAK